jgi:hypothetical protein
MGILLWRERQNAPLPDSKMIGSWRGAWWKAGGAAAVLLVLLVMAGRVVPTRDLGAKVMQGQGSLVWGYYPAPTYLALNRAGDEAFTRIVTGSPSRKIILLARRRAALSGQGNGQGPGPPTPSVTPLIRICLDGQPASTAGVRPDWAPYSFQLNLPPGVHDLRVEYVYQSGGEQVLLDRIFLN